MDSMDSIPAEERAEILARRLERSERALRDAEAALEDRMKALYRANQDLERRETDLAQKLEIESALLLGALSNTRMATAYGERERGFSVSGGAGAILGMPTGEEATLEKLVAALHPLDRDRIMREGMQFFASRETGVAHTYEHRIIRQDTGETRWLKWSIKREPSVGERPSHIVAMVRDITEERGNERRVRALQLRAERRVRELARLQVELAAAKTQAEDALSIRNRFISEMAHAIRTPLAALSGGIELLRSQVSGDGQKDLAVAREATEQLGELASRIIEEAAADADDATDALAAATRLPEQAPATAIPERPRVLVAEDTESNRYVLERLLDDLGCEVSSVENGAAAVEAVKREAFDLVVMDVMMPIMNGEQATQAIRLLPGPAARTPIIGATAHSLQSERERLLAAGMTACLAKPVRRDALETAIRTALISGGGAGRSEARFDQELFSRAFNDLPSAYRERMRDAAKTDITKYAGEVLAAVDAADTAALSKAAHSLTGVALNIGAIGIVEELATYREKDGSDAPSIEPFREAVAACLLAIDDLFDELVRAD
ncbi:response regulator [Qipengyuania flava]|uniref:response regulator n=1 Tax=Qipengyuania flava TaxID=192812 RepID=UPI001C632A54|nr:response regulator [Qipengyuania flava]QYJ06862.1 response regulator [Qipengyuania flava]